MWAVTYIDVNKERITIKCKTEESAKMACLALNTSAVNHNATMYFRDTI